MYLKKRIKTEQGTFVIEAEFREDEMDLIVEAGLLTLLQNGALPFITTDDENIHNVVPPSKLEQ